MIDNGIAMFLGNNHINDTTDYTYFVFIHEKGTFWTNEGVPNMRSFKLNLNEQRLLKFRKVFHSILPTKETPCKTEKDFSLTKCFKQFLKKSVGSVLWICSQSQTLVKQWMS